MAIEVGIARPDDAPLLLEMMEDFDALEQISGSRVSVLPALRALLMDRSLGVVGLLRNGGKIRGYFVVTWGFDLEWNGRDAFLTELYLVPDARNHGIGKLLLSSVERIATEHGARALHLMVRPENEIARKLYRGAGYVSPGRIFLSKSLHGAPAIEPPPRSASKAPAPAFALRTLQKADAPAYNALLRAAVLAHPDSLRISAADIDGAPFSTEPTADAETFAAVDAAGVWLGVGSLERERGREKRRHIAWIVRMYVPAEHAGMGVGRAILRAAIGRAPAMEGVSKLNLTVAAHNERAVRLYESEGFCVFAREHDAFRDDRSRDELSLSLSL